MIDDGTIRAEPAPEKSEKRCGPTDRGGVFPRRNPIGSRWLGLTRFRGKDKRLSPAPCSDAWQVEGREREQGSTGTIAAGGMLVAVLMTGCTLQQGTRPAPSPQQAGSGQPARVTACQLMEMPWRYDHRLVEVSTAIVFGFEMFNVWQGDCTARLRSAGIWLDYGDQDNPGAWHGHRESVADAGSRPLVIEGVPCELRKDAAFRTFDQLIHQGDEAAVRATLIGRFFAGRPIPSPGKLWGGYGQMGGYSLLVITRVVSSSPLKTALPPPPGS